MNHTPHPAHRRRLLRALLLTGAVLLLILAVSYVFRVPLLTGLARFLIVDDLLEPADIVFVLNGDPHTRPARASELLHRGLAPCIVIAREEDPPAVKMGLYPNGTDVSLGVMDRLGVPEARIIVLPVDGGATSTRDEALILRQYIGEQGIERIILVTSAFHTRRAEWIFEKERMGSSATLQISAAPHWGFDETNWWKSERGLIALTNEYIKLLYYLVTYR